MMNSKDLVSWEFMVKSMVFRDRPNASSNNEGHDDEGVEESRYETPHKHHHKHQEIVEV